MNHLDETDREVHRRVSAALDLSANRLDAVSAGRLKAARRRAVEAARKGRRWPGWWTLLAPVGATAALVAVLLYSPPQQESLSPGTAEAVRNLDLLTASESLDFYQDLEFFTWLPAGQRS